MLAAAIRFVLLNKHEGVLVFSEDGEERWWFDKKRRHTASGSTRGSRLTPRSLAGCAYAGEEVDGVTEQIPAAAWFPAVDDPDAGEVFAQTAYSARYNTALILLTLDDAE